jgi:hypothetical protein
MHLAKLPAPAAKPEQAVQQAPAAPAEPPKKYGFGDVLEPALWLAGALLLAALAYKIIGMVRESRRRKTSQDDSVHGQLAQFRHAYEHGEMSEQEFQRVHKLLTGKVKQDAGLANLPQVPQNPDSPSGNGQPQ